MRRWAFNFAAVVLLVLCLSTAVLRARSYRAHDAVERHVMQSYENAEWDTDDLVFSHDGMIVWVRHRHPDTYGEPLSERVAWHLSSLAPTEDFLQDDPEPERNDVYVALHASRPLYFGIRTTLVPDYARLQWETGTTHFVVPYADVACLAGFPAAAVGAFRLWGRTRRRMRRRDSICTACGYDLTSNASGVCPECGTSTTAGAKA